LISPSTIARDTLCGDALRRGSKSGDTHMVCDTAQTILALSAEEVSSFVKEQASSRKLSGLMKALNDAALKGDKIAQRAIEHMGFVLQP
jgi:N-acetylglucosamine kinase-like BadF-type ATPase